LFFYRQDALILLQSIIDQCTADVFAQHWEQWIKAVIQIVQVGSGYFDEYATTLCYTFVVVHVQDWKLFACISIFISSSLWIASSVECQFDLL
jgi:hypothetical protein